MKDRYELNKSVFSVRSIFEGESEILVIIHDNEGDWQFLDHGDINENNAVLVSLGQVVEYDSSVLPMLEMNQGEKAIRTNVHSKWIVKKV